SRSSLRPTPAGPGAAMALGARCQGLLGRFRQVAESLGIAHREIGEDLAVEVAAGFFQSRDEAIVREPVHPRSGVDAQDPQTAEVALARLAVACGVAEGLVHRLLGHAVGVALGPPVAGGELENFLALLSFLAAALDTRHGEPRFCPAGRWNR